MVVNDRGGLSIAQIIFYVPALVVAFIVAKKHGFGRSAGWVFLVVLSLFRIAGGIAELVAINDPTEGAFIAAAVFAGIGTSFLLIALLGIIKRLNEGMSSGNVPIRAFNLLLTLFLVGAILAIVGATDAFSKSPSTLNTGASLLKASAGLYIGAFGILTLITLYTMTRVKACIPGDRKLLYAALLALPFLWVRVIYGLLANLKINPDYNTIQGSVIIQAFMSVFEEFCVVIIFLTAGILTPVIARSEVQMGYRHPTDFDSNEMHVKPGQQSGTMVV